MKKNIFILAILCFAMNLLAYKYDCSINKLEMMTSTQLRLVIGERYNSQDDLKKLIEKVYAKGSNRLLSRFSLALQQTFISKAAVSALARRETAEYALCLLKGTPILAYTAADGSYRIRAEKTKAVYSNDADYVRISESAVSF